MKKITLRSWAKINLYLEISGKRPDGYHDIETIYQRVSLYDTITLRLIKKKSIIINSSHPDLPRDASNLAYQAAYIILKRAKSNHGVSITIKKRIPIAAGLGGGSSNAAVVLLGLNRLLRLRLKKKQLLRMAAGIGADIPFFILEESAALGRSRGDKVKSLKDIPQLCYLLIYPPLKISSKWAYQHFKLNLTKKNPGVRICIRALRSKDITQIASKVYNDLEPCITRRYKEILGVKKALRKEGVRAVLVTGSGPCVFGITKSRRGAMRAKRGIDKLQRKWATFVCRTR